MPRPQPKYHGRNSKEYYSKLAIHAARLKRILPAFAKRHGHNIRAVMDVADRAMFHCPICVGPVREPNIYIVDGEIRGVLCYLCFKAIEAVDGDARRLRRHYRFNTDYRKNRGRLGRVILLHTSGSWLLPTETMRELVEQQGSGAHRESGHDAEE
jgi:hypothetical protein